MPYAITLRLDASAAEAVQRMWRALAAGGFDDDRHRLCYPAHVTLAVHGDDAPADALRAALEKAADGWAALPVSFAGFGLFPHPAPVLWVVPVATPALLERHAALLAALPGPPPHEHYRAGAWVPHVTLSGALRDPAGALAALLPLWCPLAGTLGRVELVRFRPVEVLWSRPLAAAGA